MVFDSVKWTRLIASVKNQIFNLSEEILPWWDISGLRKGIVMRSFVRFPHDFAFCIDFVHVFCSVLILVIQFPAQSKTIIPSLFLWSKYKTLLSLLSALIGMPSYLHFSSGNGYFQLLSAGFKICLQSWKTLCSKGLHVVHPHLCPAKASRRGSNWWQWVVEHHWLQSPLICYCMVLLLVCIVVC